jgi:hypothetical protein
MELWADCGVSFVAEQTFIRDAASRTLPVG